MPLTIPRPATAAAAADAPTCFEGRFKEVFARAGLSELRPTGCGAHGDELTYYFEAEPMSDEQAGALRAAAESLGVESRTQLDTATSVPTPGLTIDLGTGVHRYGTLYCQTINLVSDRRLKTEVEGLTLGLDLLERLRPVSFRYLGGRREHMGFIAQDVREALLAADAEGDYALWCSTPVDSTEGTGLAPGMDTVESIRPDQLIPVLVRACQQLSDAVADLGDAVKKQGMQLEWAAETIAAIQKAIRERPPAV